MTLTNGTGTAQTIVDVSVTGAGVIATGPALPVTLAPGQSTTLMVQFAPMASGDAAGTVVVKTAADATAVAAYAAKGVLPSSQITVTPGAVDFGDVAVGARQTKPITVTNGSSRAITLTSVTSSGSGVGASALALPATLSGGQSLTFDVVLQPATAGAVTGYVALRGNPSTPLAVVEVRGNGIPGSAASLSASPAALDFHDVPVGTSATQTIVLTNGSADPITISQVTATGTGLSVSGLTLPAVVPPGGSASLGARFTPATVGSASGSVTVQSAALAQPLSVVQCVGNGVTVAGITSVTVQNASVQAGSSVQLVANVAASGPIDTSVTWDVESGSLGTVGAVTGVYTAPSTAGTYQVAATSNADPTKKGIGVVTVLPVPAAPQVAVSISPASASLVAGTTQTFTATVTGTTNAAATWSVQEGAAGGSVTAAGVYTAPSSAGTYHVVATSAADATKSAIATVTVSAPIPAPPPITPSTSFPTWLVDGSTRVGRTDPAGAQTSITVYAAGNEYQPFQVLIQAPSGGLTNVSATVSDFRGPSMIPSSNFPIFLEKYVKVNYGSSNVGITNWNGNAPLGAGLYADGLVPFKVNGQNNASAIPFSLSARTNQPLWVDLYVPPNTPRGTYTGSVTVTSDQGNSTVAVTLQVWGFNHPLIPSEKSFMGLNGANFTAQYKSFLLQHKLAPRALTPSDVSSFQSTYGVPAVDLSYNTGYSNFECTSAGETPPSVSEISQRMAQFPSGPTLIDYMADELTSTGYDSTLNAYAYNFHQAGALTSCDFQPRSGLMNDGSGRSACDIWIMLSRQINTSDSNYQLAKSRGNDFWWYTAEIQDSYSPKWLVDFTPLNFRMHGFINQAMGFKGILYWTLDHWSSDPWAYATDWYDSSVSGYCEGEGTLLYPPSSSSFNAGTGTAPVASLRLKWARKGIEDYELVNLLKQNGLGSTASAQLGTIATSDRNWSKDPVAVENARVNMGNALDAALNR